MEPPPIRDIVLAVATVCANNSLACQLLCLSQWETGKRKEGRSERKYAPLASCSRTAALEPKTLGCFPLFLPSSFLKGFFFFGELHTGVLPLLWSAAPLLPGLWWPHPAEWSHWLNCRKTNQRSGELIRSISGRAAGRWTAMLARLALLPLGAMQGSYRVDS